VVSIAVLLQSISGVSAINPLVAFYDIHGGKREVLFFYFVPDTTRDHHETTRDVFLCDPNTVIDMDLTISIDVLTNIFLLLFRATKDWRFYSWTFQLNLDAYIYMPCGIKIYILHCFVCKIKVSQTCSFTNPFFCQTTTNPFLYLNSSPTFTGPIKLKLWYFILFGSIYDLDLMLQHNVVHGIPNSLANYSRCLDSQERSQWVGVTYKLRISNKYGSLTRNKFLTKSVITL
jgi:hypothetical protein